MADAGAGATTSSPTSSPTSSSAGSRPRPGRKRDPSRDAPILDAALAVLAEAGYGGLTIDRVAARAGAARATVYRRWPTKAELVLAAVDRLSHLDVDLDALPDTGSLRGDLLAMVLPVDEAEQTHRMRVLAGVASLAMTEEPALARAVRGAGLGPWVRAGEVLLQRAVDRGEHPGVPPAAVATLAQVAPMLCLARAVAQEPITREFSEAVVDGVVLPAVRGSA